MFSGIDSLAERVQTLGGVAVNTIGSRRSSTEIDHMFDLSPLTWVGAAGIEPATPRL